MGVRLCKRDAVDPEAIPGLTFPGPLLSPSREMDPKWQELRVLPPPSAPPMDVKMDEPSFIPSRMGGFVAHRLTHVEGRRWPAWFPAVKQTAREEIHILESPQLFPKEAARLAEYVRLLRGVLYWGEPANRRNSLGGKS